MRLLKPGPPRQWKPIRWQNRNNRFQYFQIQLVKCPVFESGHSNVRYKRMKSQLVPCDAWDYSVCNKLSNRCYFIWDFTFATMVNSLHWPFAAVKVRPKEILLYDFCLVEYNSFWHIFTKEISLLLSVRVSIHAQLSVVITLNTQNRHHQSTFISLQDWSPREVFLILTRLHEQRVVGIICAFPSFFTEKQKKKN